jgi:DNA-binding MarR family transcriptional regulator
MSATRSQEKTLEGSGLDLSEYDVLVTLADGPPEGMRPSDLAERVLLTKSGMTRLVQRLEKRGLVGRHACPLDRRGHFIAMTAVGRHLLRRAAPGLLRGLASVLAPLSAQDLNALQRAAERMTETGSAHSPV